MASNIVAVLACCSLLLPTLAGCNKSETMLPVEGQIKYKGKALTKGAVVFHPDAGKGNTTKHEPRAAITDGRYTVMTHPHQGAPPGWYKIAVIVTEPSDPKNMYSEPRWLIPQKFGNPEESDLPLEVRNGAPAGAYDLDLK